jgi:signal transduction histidine kinase
VIEAIQIWWRENSLLGVKETDSYPDRRRKVMTNHINIALIVFSIVLLLIDTLEKLLREEPFFGDHPDRESGIGYRFILAIILAIINLNLSANGYLRIAKLLLLFATPYLYLILPLQLGNVYSELYLWYPYAAIPFMVLPLMLFDFKKDLLIHLISAAVFLTFMIFAKELLDFYSDTQIAIQSVIRENSFFYRVVPAVISTFSLMSIYYLITINDRDGKKLDERNRALSETLDELNRTQEQLVRKEKMAVVGLMSSELTHEISTPISAIKANINMLAYDQKHRLRLLRKIGAICSEEELDELSLLLRHMHEKVRSSADSLNQEALYERTLSQQIQQLTVSLQVASRWAKCFNEIGIMDAYPYAKLVQAKPYQELIDLVMGEYQQHHSFRVSRQAISQAEKLIQKLKSYSYTKDLAEVSLFKLSTVVHDSLDLLDSQMKMVDCDLSVDCKLPEILGQQEEILQVVNNLLINALQAMDHQGSLIIRLEGMGANQQLIIEDSGGGVPMTDQKEIFEAFFTTKPKGKGTGLGLHICKQIISKHKGTIEWENTRQGARFIVTLPAAN